MERPSALQTPRKGASPTPPPTTTPAAARAAPVPSSLDVSVSGATMVIVRRAPPAAEPAADPTPGAAVDLGALGSAPLTARLTGSRIVAHPTAPDGWYVEVIGTGSRDTLKEVASALHA